MCLVNICSVRTPANDPGKMASVSFYHKIWQYHSHKYLDIHIYMKR